MLVSKALDKCLKDCNIEDDEAKNDVSSKDEALKGLTFDLHTLNMQKRILTLLIYFELKANRSAINVGTLDLGFKCVNILLNSIFFNDLP